MGILVYIDVPHFPPPDDCLICCCILIAVIGVWACS